MRWVRPSVVAVLVLAIVVGFLIGKIGSEAFFGFATGVIVFWFKDRSDSKRDKGV